MLRTASVLAIMAYAALAAPVANAATPTCVLPERKISWPVANPVWEFCWVAYQQSAGPRGSGLDLRNVHLNGRLVLKQAHAPMLFAEYTSSTCYRDWKDDDTSILMDNDVRNQVGVPDAIGATTSCDRSNHPTTSYGTCPYQLAVPAGASCSPSGGTLADISVAFEDRGTHLLATAQYIADWYMYSSRFAFYADGSFEPEFGFGNRNGTFNNTTHWHHNYWRLDFAIEGDANDQILEDSTVQSTEFARLRCAPPGTAGNPCSTERRWTVRDSVTGRGFELLPSANDYVAPTNESGRNFHLVDVMGTVYQAAEFGDNPTWQLNDCGMDEVNLANGGDLDGATGAGTDVVLWYRVAVKDQTGVNSMVCKKAGPAFAPVGNWAATLFEDGFE